jgi:DNA-binding response OmpR family regulator
MMPNKTGLEMAKEIKQNDPNSNIIILSAHSEVDKLLSAIDVGVIKYFIKPFDPDELLEYIISLEGSIANQLINLKDGFVFNKSSRSLYKDSQYVKLSKNEVLFLELFIKDYEAGNLIVSYDKIKSSIWGEDVSDERLRTFIRRFRDKTSKELLDNRKGQGYQIAIIS